jgi:catechol 2,3-dioxygenase-like lactoylglutathione lyase family enzyme
MTMFYALAVATGPWTVWRRGINEIREPKGKIAMITAFHHTQITAPKGSEAVVRQFYGGVLGLREIPVNDALRGRNLIWFQVGDRSLHVGFEDGIDRRATGAHLAYEVSDVQEFRRKLTAAGFELIEQPKFVGLDRFHVRDPFGNRVEIIGSDGSGQTPAY